MKVEKTLWISLNKDPFVPSIKSNAKQENIIWIKSILEFEEFLNTFGTPKKIYFDSILFDNCLECLKKYLLEVDQSLDHFPEYDCHIADCDKQLKILLTLNEYRDFDTF